MTSEFVPDIAAAEPIRSLVARIVHAADEAPVEEYTQLYTSDAVWEMTGTKTGVGCSPNAPSPSVDAFLSPRSAPIARR